MAIRFEDGNLVHVVQYIQCPQDRQVVTDSDMGRALFDLDQGGAAHPGMICQIDLAPSGSFPANDNPLAQLAKRVPNVDRVVWFNVCHGAQYCGLVCDMSNIMASWAQIKDDGFGLGWQKAGPAKEGPDSPIAPDNNAAKQQHASTGKSGYGKWNLLGARFLLRLGTDPVYAMCSMTGPMTSRVAGNEMDL